MYNVKKQKGAKFVESKNKDNPTQSLTSFCDFSVNVKPT